VNAAGAVAFDEAGTFEYAQVARDGGRRDAEGLGENGHGTFAALAEANENGAASGVGESCEDGVHGSGIVNHRVKYSWGGKEVKEYLTEMLSVAGRAKKRAAGAKKEGWPEVEVRFPASHAALAAFQGDEGA
jgi:hypothetical protein